MNLFRFFIKSYNRTAWINVLIIIELLVCFILGTFVLAFVGDSYTKVDGSFDNMNNCYYIGNYQDYYKKLNDSNLDSKLLSIYKSQLVKDQYRDINVISKSIVDKVTLTMVEGVWLKDCALNNDYYNIVMNKGYALQNNWELNNIYELELVGKEAKNMKINIKVVGFLDMDKNTDVQVYDSSIMPQKNEIMTSIYLLVPDGEDAFLDYNKQNAISSMIIENPSNQDLDKVFNVIKQIPRDMKYNFEETYSEELLANKNLEIIFIIILLLTFVTILISSLVLQDMRIKELSIISIFGITNKSKIIIEILRSFMNFIIPFVISLIIVASILGTGILITNSMKEFFIISGIIFVVYALINTCTLVNSLKKKPLEGIREE